jgi:hypothetical protein
VTAPAAILRDVLTRLRYLARLREVAEELTRAGTTADRLRASDLAALVSVAVDVENSPRFRADLTTALHGAGWRSVKRAQVRLWKGFVLR